MGLFSRVFFYLLISAATTSLYAQFPFSFTKEDSVLIKVESQVYKLNPDDGASIPVYFVQLDDLQYKLDTLLSGSQSRNLSEHAVTSLKKTQRYLDSVRTVILDKMQHLELVMYEEALEAKTKGDSAQANILFIKSLQHKPGYSPAAYELIKLNLTPSASAYAASCYEKYAGLTDSSENPYYYSLFKGLASQVLDQLLAHGDALVKKDLPADAFKILEEAAGFNTRHPSPQGKEKIDAASRNAHKGMYQGLITIADRALSFRKWDLARYYYQKAEEYQQSNAGFLTDSHLSSEGLIKVSEASRQAALIKKTVGRRKHGHRRRKSRYSYQKSIKKRKTKAAKPERPVKDTLVISYLKRSDSCLKYEYYGEAVQWCDSALTANNKLHAVEDTAIIHRYNRAGRKIIADTLNAASYQVWKNNLAEAVKILSDAGHLQRKYYLDRDEEIIKALKDIEVKIKERKCFTVQSDYETYIFRALNRFLRSDFLDGRDFLIKAGQLLEHNKDCGIADSMLVKTRQKYDGLIRWQEHWNEVRQAWSVKDYPLFYREYDSAYHVYTNERLINKGISMKSLVSYLESQSDVQAYKAMATLCLENGQLGEAWLLIKSLKKEKINMSEAKDLLIKAGSAMARDDKKKQKSSWQQELKSLPSWYRMAKKSYFRTLKNKDITHGP